MLWLPVTPCSYIANKLAVVMSFISLRRAGATWRSGYATVCKTVYTGSIPVVASILFFNDLGEISGASFWPHFLPLGTRWEPF